MHVITHSESPAVGANVTAHNTDSFSILSITVISGVGDGKCENPKAHFVFLISKKRVEESAGSGTGEWLYTYSRQVGWALSPTAL